LDVRRISELLAELVGVGAGDVIVLAVVANEAERFGEAERFPVQPDGDRPRTRRAIAQPAPRPVRTQGPDGSDWALTERERAVALLAGRALTNQQIANRLRISPHTVNFHLRQIFRKLGIDSRVSLARMVWDQPPVAGAPTGAGCQPTGPDPTSNPDSRVG
jgi:DNA-binding CsgD family transcriptional regulator